MVEYTAYAIWNWIVMSHDSGIMMIFDPSD